MPQIQRSKKYPFEFVALYFSKTNVIEYRF